MASASEKITVSATLQRSTIEYLRRIGRSEGHVRASDNEALSEGIELVVDEAIKEEA